MSALANDLVVFDEFQLDRRSGGLFRKNASGGLEQIAIGSRALDVLAVLLAHHGEVVSKKAIMDAVWPDMAVEEKNLTVQISALRRVLDDGRTDQGCIQTEAGRGYRFVAPVTRLQADDGPGLAPVPAARPRPRLLKLAALAVLLLGIGFGATTWLRDGQPAPRGLARNAPSATDRSVGPAPRLSLVVLPFENFGGDARDNQLADGITDDLTSELAYIPEARIIARQSAYTFKGKPRDVREIGEQLGVRYVLEGSIRRIDAAVRFNVQLIAADTGAHLWSDRFDENVSDLEAGQETITARMRAGIVRSMFGTENARSLRERPNDPDALDLVLRAAVLQQLPPNGPRDATALALYEQALAMDPASVPALVGVAYFLFQTAEPGDWISYEKSERIGRLLAQARAFAPNSPNVLNTTVMWLRFEGRCQEVIEAAGQAIETEASRTRRALGVYNELGECQTITGHAEKEIPLQAELNRRNPGNPYAFNRYRRMGFASLLLGRDQDAVTFLQRSIALSPESTGIQFAYRCLAAALARTGQLAEARVALAEADRIWPYDTVRSHYPENALSPVYTEQIKGFQAALRLAGARDHADEDADFGVPADGLLQSKVAGPTPTSASGITTVRTAELPTLLAQLRPVILDTMSNSWGRSIPGAVGLKHSGSGGSFHDAAQERLRDKLRELTAGDLGKPVIAVGYNSERFDGYNLALRLAALGYTNVYWYRGGREAWEVANQPETELTLLVW